MGQIKILSIRQENLNAVNQVINKTIKEANYAKQDKYTFLFKALETYKDKKFEEGELVLDVIKVTLSKDEEKARLQWFEGIELEDMKYFGWFATPGGMKQENEKEDEKCEAFFIREDLKDFITWFENIISLNQFNLLNDKEIYVNKQVLSRIALTTSILITEINMPNIIILPKATIDFSRIYKTVVPNEKTEEITLEKQIEYSLEDYDFEGEIDVFDGGGIATPEVFEQIGQTLKRNDIDFAVIRGYGIGIKGLITRFDIIKYLDVFYKEDTTIADENKYCKKVDGHYELKDMYGKWREVTDNTLLLNESMVKLADLFAEEVKDAKKDIIVKNDTYGMELIEEKLEKYNTEIDINTYNLLNKLYITKVNKPESELTDYRTLCYQLFNALALTDKEYHQLANQDYILYRKLVKPYSVKDADAEKKEFRINADYVNLFFRNITKNKVEYDEENPAEYDIDFDENELNHTDKTAMLIQLDVNNVELKTTKMQIKRMIEKKVRSLAAGKVTTKAQYCYVAIDPISYMNFAMTRELGTNGLAEGQFYNRKCENGDIRTIYRNPLMAFSEVHNIEFVRNNFFDNYFCKSSELIYFNQKSDIYSLCGSMDSDGDSVTVIDNEIIRQGVVEIDKPFFFSSDGVKVPYKYDNYGKFYCSWKPSGNLIGSVSMLASTVNTNSQWLPKYYSPDSNKFYYYDQVLEILAENNFEGITKDSTDTEIKEAIKKLIEAGHLMYSNNKEIDAEIVREQIKKQFLEDIVYIYPLLHTSSLVIDTPKTMNVIDRDMYIEPIQKVFQNSETDTRIFKPLFLKYRKYKWEIGKKETYSSFPKSFMDRTAELIQKNILNYLENYNKQLSDKGKQLKKLLENNKYDADKLEECKEKMIRCYNEYSEISSKIREKHKNDRAEKSKLLKELDAEYLLIADDARKQYDTYTIAQTLAELDKCSEAFLINLFFSHFLDIDKLKPSMKIQFVPDENGEVEYLYKKYKKLEKLVNFNDNTAKNVHLKELARLNAIKEVRFDYRENPDMVKEITNKIQAGLDENGYYELELNGLKVFEDFAELIEGKDKLRIDGFMLNKNNNLAITSKSFGIYYYV